MPRHRRLLLLVLSTVCALPLLAAPVGASGLNPSANIAPQPNFLSSGGCSGSSGSYSCENPCVSPALTWPAYSGTPACTNYVLASYNHARSVLGLEPLVLPTNWYHLTIPEQLFVVLNLERQANHLPPYLGLNAALDSAALTAARRNADPSAVMAPAFPAADGPGHVIGFGAAWAAGFSVITAYYIWMYDDGWAGTRAATSNVACTSPGAAGCWAHRDELLGSDPGYNPGVGLRCTTCVVGAAFAPNLAQNTSSFTVTVQVPAHPVPLIFTWASERPYLTGTPPTSTTSSSAPPTTAPVTQSTTPSSTPAQITVTSIAHSANVMRAFYQLTVPASRVTLTVFRGSSCVVPVHSAGVPSSSLVGYVTSVGTGFYSGTSYSLSLTALTDQGSVRSACHNVA